MRKTTTLTALIAAGALAVGGVALAPAALAATADDGGTTTTENDERRGPGAGHGPGHGPGHGGERGEHRGAAIESILDTLGITADELRDARQHGASLAELAEAQGVEVATLVDALITAAEEHIAEHVANGDLSPEEADERLAEVEERITDRVNGEAPERGDGERRIHGHGGHRG